MARCDYAAATPACGDCGGGVGERISQYDLLLVGNLSAAKVRSVVAVIERQEGRELTYSILSYDEFYYRLSVRDRFITTILTNKHTVLVDVDNILKEDEGENHA